MICSICQIWSRSVASASGFSRDSATPFPPCHHTAFVMPIVPLSSCLSYRFRHAYHTAFVRPCFCQSAGNQISPQFPIFPIFPTFPAFPIFPAFPAFPAFPTRPLHPPKIRRQPDSYFNANFTNCTDLTKNILA